MLKGSSTQLEIGLFPPVLMMACAGSKKVSMATLRQVMPAERLSHSREYACGSLQPHGIHALSNAHLHKQGDHPYLIWLVIECLLVYEGIRGIDSALGDGDVQRLSKVSALARAVRGIVASARAPA